MTDRELMQMALDAMKAVSVDEHLCNAAHHAKKDRHGINEPCPIAKRFNDIAEALRARLAQPEQEIEPDRPHVEGDGCPTEKAVLQRFWREHQKQEPVAWMYDWYDETEDIDGVPIGGIVHDWISKDYDEAHSPTMGCHNIRPLYTSPPQREWQGLTDEEILEEYRQSYGDDGNLTDVYFARAIEAKLKEKNT